jgi:ferritin
MMSECLGNELRLSNVELEAMSKTHKMSLNGFKRYFRYRARDRFKHSLCLKKWSVDYADTNIPFDVSYSSGNTLMNLEAILTYVFNESEKHLEKLKDIMDMAFKEKEITLANKINCLIDDQEEEHKCLKRLLTEWNMAKANSDTSWISRKDFYLHKKYKIVEKYKK